MSDGEGSFEILDEASAVTSDDQDSVASEIEQSEADALRRQSRTTGADIHDSEPKVETPRTSSKWSAQCRYCRRGFETNSGALAHEGECQSEPVAECRYCHHAHIRHRDPQEHLYSCEGFQTARERERRNARSHANRGRDSDPLSGLFVDPQPHEFAAYLKWDLSEKIENPLRSYFGLNSLQKEHGFEEHGRLRTSITVDESEWTVEFGYKECGIAPRDDSGFRLDEVREYLVYVYPEAYNSWSDAAQEARQRVYYRISPRWPDIETKEGLKPMSNPCDIEGFDVEVDGSNFQFSEYPEVLQEALGALRERQGFRFSSYTPICPEDFDPEALHKSSNIVDAEYYVRVDKDETGRMYAYDGTLHRISLLLASDRDGYAKTVRDDRECEGHYHTATIGSERAAALIGGHTLAKEFKHYHMRNPDAVEGTPLENPKVAVAYQNSKNDDTLYWSDLSRLERELDEGLLNLLEWSDIPTRPDHQVFVADDYFEPSGSRRWRKLLREQLPRIQDRQEENVLGATMNAAPTDAEILDQLLTDGGRVSPHELMESIGCHIDTVYTALKRLSSIVEHNYGEVKLRSKYIAQEIVGRIESVRDGLATDFEGALDDLVRAETYEGREDPFVAWLNDWGGRIQERADDRDLLDVGFKFGSRRSAIEALRSGALKWAEASGEQLYRFGNLHDVRFRVKGEGAKYIESLEMLLGGKVHFATA